MGLTAIQRGDLDEAAHQIDHINQHITSEHLDEMQFIRALLDIGLLQAEQKMADMVAGYVPQSVELDQLNVRLAVEALALGDMTEAARHLDAVETGVLSVVARQAQDALESGDSASAAAGSWRPRSTSRSGDSAAAGCRRSRSEVVERGVDADHGLLAIAEQHQRVVGGKQWVRNPGEPWRQ